MRRRTLLLGLLLLCPAIGPAYEVLFTGESPYHQVRVVEDDGYRFLSFDETRGTQSALKLSDPLFLEYVYTRLTFASLAFVPHPQDVLFVGLGGGTMPKFLHHHYPEVNVDVAEIDPVVIDVAKKYFGLKVDERMKIHPYDGRVFLRKAKTQYDIIVLDAYNASSIPFHLTTKEFFEIVRKALKPNGVVVSNIWSPRMNEYFEAEIKTFQAVFPELYIFPGLSSGNYIFIATNRKGKVEEHRLVERARQIDGEKKFHFELADLIKTTYQYATNRPVEAAVLTDERAPVDVMRWREVKGE